MVLQLSSNRGSLDPFEPVSFMSMQACASQRKLPGKKLGVIGRSLT